MALVTDGGISTVADLQAIDSSILETARVEEIALPAKLILAETMIKLEVAAFLSRIAPTDGNPEAVLRRVVVTPGLQRWHALKALAEVYSDAYSSQLNDRYLGKWNAFSKLAKETGDLLYEVGIGMVGTPVPRAERPSVTAAAGIGRGGAFLVRVAWRNHQGQLGVPSDSLLVEVDAGKAAIVDAGTPPPDCVSFDVFVGESEDTITKQNLEPVQSGTLWTMPAQGISTGQRPGSGQAPEYFLRRRRTY
ncbi:MAG: hypothetical protein IT168_02615 [Bryobacterales bacterium]|nr:hypothetical protein [Bryobacterales bacterium]